MEQLDGILHDASASIEEEYFLLPIHGSNPVHRERVYCYELYHQMRLRWPATAYRLNGEIDKGGHPYFPRKGGKPKPDLLVHVPGGGDNYAVIEVKSSRAKAKEIRKDLNTLCRLKGLGYQRAIYLVYGSKNILPRIERCAADVTSVVEVWFHPAVHVPAEQVFRLTPPE